MTDKVIVKPASTKVQKQETCKPLPRSQRLRALQQLNDKTTRSRKQAPTGEIRSLYFRRQSSNGYATTPMKTDVTSTSRSRGQKRVREDQDSGSRKRGGRNEPQLICADTLWDNKYIGPIDYWRKSGYVWPQGDWSKNHMDTNSAVSYLLARKRSTGSLRRKRSDNELPTTEVSTTPSDQKSRAVKSAPYRDPRYIVLLRTKGSYMGKDDLGIVETSKMLVQKLLSTEQSVPRDSLFRDDIFEATCSKLIGRNETRVIRDISLLIVPSAEILTTYGMDELACLTESLNEGWNNSIPFTQTRPQPDYAVGFRREAFSEEQLKKLEPFVGNLYDQSYFMATYYLYFPFLTCEVKCGAAALDVADLQNAHSMTLAVRAVVELFRLVRREKELNREILAFSISHDHRSVRIYGHYAVIENNKTTFYRHPIHEFCFTALDGKDKWIAYKFTKSVYRTWMPVHLTRLRFAIDAIPADVSFEVSQSELQFSDRTGLSHDFVSHGLVTSTTESASVARDDSQLQPIEASISPDTSITKESTGEGTGKAKRGRR